jgi:hypothetical protein
VRDIYPTGNLFTIKFGSRVACARNETLTSTQVHKLVSAIAVLVILAIQDYVRTAMKPRQVRDKTCLVEWHVLSWTLTLHRIHNDEEATNKVNVISFLAFLCSLVLGMDDDFLFTFNPNKSYLCFVSPVSVTTCIMVELPVYGEMKRQPSKELSLPCNTTIGSTVKSHTELVSAWL